MATVRDLWVSKRTGRRTAKYGVGRRYQAVWRVDGRERTRGFRRKLDADRYAEKMEVEVEEGRYVDRAAGQVTVRAFAEKWLADQLQLRTSSRSRYRFHLTKHVYPVIGDQAIRTVSRSTIQGLVSGLVAKGLAPGTVRGIYRTISIVFAAAAADQVIPAARNPCTRVKVPEASQSRAVALTREQLFGLAEYMPAHFRALPLVGAGCGLRPGELFGLELDPSHSLDMLGRRVLVRQQLTSDTGGGQPYLTPPKTAAGVREVPLADETLEVLAEHMAKFPPVEVEVEDRTGTRPAKRTARLVFYAVEETRAGMRRTPLRRSTFNTTWTRAVKRAREAGVELPARVTPHALRHTYVSLMIASGVNVKAIQTLVGHSDIRETLNTYGHLLPDQHEVSRAAIGSALRPTEASEPAGLRLVEEQG